MSASCCDTCLEWYPWSIDIGLTSYDYSNRCQVGLLWSMCIKATMLWNKGCAVGSISAFDRSTQAQTAMQREDQTCAILLPSHFIQKELTNVCLGQHWQHCQFVCFGGFEFDCRVLNPNL